MRTLHIYIRSASASCALNFISAFLYGSSIMDIAHTLKINKCHLVFWNIYNLWFLDGLLDLSIVLTLPPDPSFRSGIYHSEAGPCHISALAWFIRYIYYWNIQFLNKVIFIKTKDFPPLGIGSVCSRQKTIKLKILLP